MYNYFYDNFDYPNDPFWNSRFPMNPNIPFNLPFANIYGPTPNPNIYGNPIMNMPPKPVHMNPVNPYNKINKNILILNNELRKLWEQHVFWTKIVIASILNGSPDIQLVSQRLLRNPDDFEKLLSKYYGHTASEKFRDLLRQHLLIAADLVNALKKKDSTSINSIENKWYKNADLIAEVLSSINPYWNRDVVRKMMYDHLSLTKSEAVDLFTNKYEDAIIVFDKIENQALEMADMYTEGIIKQFPNKL